MTGPLVIPMPGNEAMGGLLAKALNGEIGQSESRQFPDGESYFRFETPVTGRSVLLVCTLDHPDPKFLPLMFAASAARDLGAVRVGLAAPYLAYMRQDRRFKDGEAVTSHDFARMVSNNFDWLATVDPHLHRIASLADLYTIPAGTAQAAPAIAEWIRTNVKSPLLFGPDEESGQWVGAVAQAADAPHMVLRKIRHGDRDVEITVPEIGTLKSRTPVLVDDIVSSGRTVIETVSHLVRAGTAPPVCIAVHGIFADTALAGIEAAGAGRVVTTNSIPHETNQIDISSLLTDAIRPLL